MYEPQEMQTQSFAGTHQFLAPEIAEGAPNLIGEKGSARNDLVNLINSIHHFTRWIKSSLAPFF